LCFDFTPAGCAIPGGPLEGRIRLSDEADAFTYNLGILLKPSDTIKLGFSYRGRTDLRFDDATVKLGGSFNVNRSKAEIRPVPLPPVINAGLFWQITPSWGAEFVYEFTRWSEFNALKASFSPAPIFLPLGPFGVVSSFNLPQDWKDTSTLRLGSFYRLNNNLEFRGGIAVEETPIPAKTLNPAIPGADILTLNLGLGYKWNNLDFDLGYQATFYKNRRVSNSELEGLPATGIPFVGAPGRDKYETFINFVSLSVGYRF
jgi:long-chain fatty acid transport protein